MGLAGLCRLCAGTHLTDLYFFSDDTIKSEVKQMNQESTEKTLRSVFKNPDSSSRGTPFWVWNGKAEPEKMMKQIACFKEMETGGFIVHSRTGLKTPYLGKAFMIGCKPLNQKIWFRGLPDYGAD